MVAQPTSDLVRSYKMTIEIKEITDIFGVTKEIVFVYDGNGGCTQIEKSIYDEQQAQAEHFTPSV
jgi:hypothetical protein